jgi:NADPH:quinone reductase-like Zn-dependent oxidoreductase
MCLGQSQLRCCQPDRLVSRSCLSSSPDELTRPRMNRDYMPIPDASLGCDFSGTIEDVSPNVTKKWSKGDRVCGWTLGNNIVRKDEGAFAEYCVANADLCIRVPDRMTDEEAASPPAGIATAGMGLFQKHNMLFPGEGEGGKHEWVLIYGGTSATATLAIQLAKL